MQNNPPVGVNDLVNIQKQSLWFVCIMLPSAVGMRAETCGSILNREISKYKNSYCPVTKVNSLLTTSSTCRHSTKAKDKMNIRDSNLISIGVWLSDLITGTWSQSEIIFQIIIIKNKYRCLFFKWSEMEGGYPSLYIAEVSHAVLLTALLMLLPCRFFGTSLTTYWENNNCVCLTVITALQAQCRKHTNSWIHNIHRFSEQKTSIFGLQSVMKIKYRWVRGNWLWPLQVFPFFVRNLNLICHTLENCKIRFCLLRCSTTAHYNLFGTMERSASTTSSATSILEESLINRY